MKLTSFCLLLATGLTPLASSYPTKHGSGSGSGPYPATYFTEPTLQNHTLYLPTRPPDDRPLPVLIWGNGGCRATGTRFANFLTNIASYGYLVIASGPPNGTGLTTSQFMRDAILWVSAKADQEHEYCGKGKWKYANIDTNAIAVAGQSCGGLETYQMRDDERVKVLGIFNSGLIAEGSVPDLPDDGNVLEDPGVIAEVKKPVFYFIGGWGDVAYPNAKRDYHALEGVPKWTGNFPVGHSGTYTEDDGGAFGVAAVKWLEWVLRGDERAGGFFIDGGAEEAGWEETEGEGLEVFGSV
ncbi:hypothetical protein BJY04DRAFT_220844 [Aspergillus karnatakaensis]|uniref:uncharacterized protein n=1 Tax=Aspergillus karnatakaensis TaxID=1810916 RepID=UPI003CCDABC1